MEFFVKIVPIFNIYL